MNFLLSLHLYDGKLNIFWLRTKLNIRGHLLRCLETLENNNNDNKINNHHLYLQPYIRVVLSMVDILHYNYRYVGFSIK